MWQVSMLEQLVHMTSSSRGHGIRPVSNVRVFPCALLGCAAGYSTAPFTRDSKAVTSVFCFQVRGATHPIEGSAHTTHLHKHVCIHTHIRYYAYSHIHKHTHELRRGSSATAIVSMSSFHHYLHFTGTLSAVCTEPRGASSMPSE